MLFQGVSISYDIPEEIQKEERVTKPATPVVQIEEVREKRGRTKTPGLTIVCHRPDRGRRQRRN